MKYIYCWVALSLLAYPSQAFYGKYPIQNFTPKDYKAGIQNIDFAQNRDMTLFVANNLGVLSCNGKEWEVHAFKTGKKERSLAFDENTNRLYAGSQGEFGYFDGDWNYTSLVEKIPEPARDFDEVWEVILLNSSVFFCTFQGIYAYDGDSISVIEYDGGLNRSFQANGKLFTQSKEGKLLEVRDLAIVSTYPQRQNNQIIAGIVPRNEGYLLFYNSGEIEFSTTFGVAPIYEDLIKALRGKYVNHVFQLSDGRLAISTQTSGVFLYDPQKQSIENITAEEGLLSNACLRAFQDYSGNLWVGMQNGIALIYTNSPMRFINQEINLQGSGYDAFEVDAGTYFTTSNGIYFLGKDATQSVFLEGTEGPAYGMQMIAGKLYAGHHTGLFLLENGKARRLANTDGLWQVKQLHSNPEFAIGGTYSGLFLFRLNENLELQAVQKIDGFNESSRFFEEDHKGRIWVGQFYKGLFQLNLTEDLSSATVKEDHELPVEEQVILSNIDNEIYFATQAGLYKLEQSTDKIVKAETLSKEIGQQQLYLLVQDKKKNIHVFGENLVGFFKQISANNFAFVRSSLFQLRYSFNNDLLNVSVNTNNGVLFNANEGFIYYNPELEDGVTVEKPLLVSKVFSVAENEVIYARKPFETKPENIGSLVVSPRAKVLQFAIESFQFNDVSSQQFRYFLKGFDDDFGEWTNNDTKEYSNLREGEYEFFVQTRNYLGETVTSQPLFFKVRPPLHRSLFAKIVYVLLGFSALFLVSRFQRYRYKRKTEAIEEAKRQELAEKQQKLLEVEQQKEQELLQLEKEKVESELRYLNNLLAASTMNLVVKNEFMENIKEELKEVKRKGGNVEIKRALEQIVKEIDSTLRLQEDWEQFEHHFNQVHGDFLTRLRNEFLDLSPNEQKLCAFLRLNLNTKDIANLMSISLRGVEVARYRLRRKLDLDKGQNLSKFILEY
ncbi:MAG: hypothetical protein H6563_11595 [Lewinellaceae bacterium]|nr:hypothetical protein [Lewinellaceae bacterium]